MKEIKIALTLAQLSVIAVLFLLFGSPVARAEDTSFTQKIAVPAYFPDHLKWDLTARTNWDNLELGYGVAKLIVINPYDGTVDPWNPANGGFNQELKDRVTRAKARGVTVLGYTWTNKRQRSWDKYVVDGRVADIGIKQDIDNYFDWYGVDGIFADDTTADCNGVNQDNNPGQPWMAPSYKRIYDYVKAKGGVANTVVLNPGIQPAECFMTASDIVVNFEGYYNDYVNNFDTLYANPGWLTNYAPSRFWHLIHTAPSGITEMNQVIQLSKQRRAGWVYVTPTLNNDPITNDPHNPNWKWLNAWDDLTSSDQNFWKAEVGAVGPTISVTSSENDGPGSLREAISQANSNPDLTTIFFNIPATPSQVVKINLLSQLPTISAPLILDASSQPGFNATPLIELNGSNLAAGQDCLVLSGGNSTIRGLVINRCPGNAIKITINGGNTIEGNYLGTDANGTSAWPNGGSGIEITNVPNNLIGGITPASRNLISANTWHGVLIKGSGASGNQVLGNYIGTSADGTTALGNSYGILIYGAGANTIGGTLPGARNLISGNTNYGIFIGYGGSGGNQVLGNFIGTSANGNVALPNGASGIRVNGLPSNLIGGEQLGAGNLISGNGYDGVFIDGNGATANRVLGNYIGTNANGTAPLPNKGNGVEISGVANNTIGGTTVGGRNLISGNTWNGVLLKGMGASGNQVLGNLIGTSADGSAALNNRIGVLLRAYPKNPSERNTIKAQAK